MLPIWIVPLFYRLVPLADEALRERLLALARPRSRRPIGVFVADQSRRVAPPTRPCGLGRTRRIILYDTLLASFTPEEIEAVLAHELGHHVHGDVARGLVVQGGCCSSPRDWSRADSTPALGSGTRRGRRSRRASWLALLPLGLGLVQLPLGNGFSRWIERQADDFALATTRNAPAFIAAMERLASLNLAERRPQPPQGDLALLAPGDPIEGSRAPEPFPPDPSFDAGAG